MSIAYTIDTTAVIGGKKWLFGTYTDSSAGTVGNIVTGLKCVESFVLTPYGSSAATNCTAVVETFPLNSADGAVTIITDASQVGSYIAIGY